MAFERFSERGRGYKPKVSIWKRGQIGFNQGAVKRFDLDKYQYAVLFFDAENKRIGFKFTNDVDEDGISKLTVKDTGAIMSAKSFLDFHEIDYEETRKYDIGYDEKEKLYVVKLLD